jgi:hypothetical protein
MTVINDCNSKALWENIFLWERKKKINYMKSKTHQVSEVRLGISVIGRVAAGMVCLTHISVLSTSPSKALWCHLLSFNFLLKQRNDLHYPRGPF